MKMAVGGLRKRMRGNQKTNLKMKLRKTGRKVLQTVVLKAPSIRKENQNNNRAEN